MFPCFSVRCDCFNSCLLGIFFLVCGMDYCMAFDFRKADPSTLTWKHKMASKQMFEQELIRRLLKDYDWRVRPHGLNETVPESGGPVRVSVNIYLRSISQIDDVNMEYSTQFTFREEWVDLRLAYAHLLTNVSPAHRPKYVILVPDDKSQQIWIPDSFFQNEKTATRHFVDKPNIMIRIHPHGEILYSVRLSMSLSCHMNMADYPLDKQVCAIDMASYAYTTDDILYEWKKENPIQLKNTVNDSLPTFALEDIRVTYCTSKTTTGEYSCLRTEFYLRRLFSYYLVRLYIPTFLLVVVSWVSFWLDKTSAPARVTLGITTLLTMTTQASDINSKLHPVSYTKAIDVWIGVCLAFIFGALLEFALINYASNEMKIINRKISTQPQYNKPITKVILDWPSAVQCTTAINTVKQSPLLPLDDATAVWKRRAYEYPVANEVYATTNGVILKQKKHRMSRFKKWLKSKYVECKDTAKMIDMVSRIVFPSAFFTFNLVYWAVYLS